jgi:hypothetical protein
MGRKKRELRISPENLNQLDHQLQELALMDFELFCKTFGIDKTKAFVCFEIQKKKSLTQIGMKLNIGKTAVFAIAKNCPK